MGLPEVSRVLPEVSVVLPEVLRVLPDEKLGEFVMSQRRYKLKILRLYKHDLLIEFFFDAIRL